MVIVLYLRYFFVHFKQLNSYYLDDVMRKSIISNMIMTLNIMNNLIY